MLVRDTPNVAVSHYCREKIEAARTAGGDVPKLATAKICNWLPSR
jgi:hypothetical protein